MSWGPVSVGITSILLAGCVSGPTSEPGQKTVFRGTERWAGLEADQGFGSALAMGDEGLWTGAPHGPTPQVYSLDDQGAHSILKGEGRLGSTLVAWGSGFIAGAPLASEGKGQLFLHTGEAIQTGPRSLGLALWASEDLWIAAHGGGWVDSRGTNGESLSRPSAVASLQNKTGIGSALGSTALGFAETKLAHTEGLDMAGFSLAVADIDADGSDEWILGAPGANRVEIRDADGRLETTIQGDTGRFGAALATGDLNGDGCPELVIGAPAAGEAAQGAVHVYAGGSLEQLKIWEGIEEGDQLGFALAISNGFLAIGLPGSAQNSGAVLRVQLD